MADHPWSTDIDHFFAVLLASGLLSHHEFQRASACLSNSHRAENALDQLCFDLIENEILTEWQCGKLRAGKYKGFYLDKYCLLGEIKYTDTEAYYAARDTTEGTRVTLAITPPSRNTNRRTAFRIVEQLGE